MSPIAGGRRGACRPLALTAATGDGTARLEPVARRRSGARGSSLIDLVFALGLVLLMAAMAIPQARAGVERARGLAAARYLAARMALARAQAVNGSAAMALKFDDMAGDVAFAAYVDGNGNGVRTQDIESGIDRPVGEAVRLSHLFPGVVIGLAGDVPANGAVQIGRTTLLSFTPSGTATSGTIHVLGADGTQWAVRVLGATARTRVLRYVPATGEWLEAY